MRARMLCWALMAAGLPGLARAESLYPIHQVQGSTAQSPRMGESLIVEGLVTAWIDNGFYLQAPVAAMDADPATSEAIFVFTGPALPPSVVIGNRVRVTGLVQEVRDEGIFQGPTRTQIALQDILVLATGQALPPVVTVNLAELQPEADANQLERYEGMRVRMPGLTIASATGGAFIPAAGAYAVDGVLVAHAGPQAIRREAGLAPGIPDPSGLLPRSDGNPERIRIESATRPGASPWYLDANDRLIGTTGIFDDRQGLRTLLPEPMVAPVVEYGSRLGNGPPFDSNEAGIAAMALEPFFDDVDAAGRSEPVMLPDAYAARTSKLGDTLHTEGLAGDIIAVTGIENVEVLDDVAARMNWHADNSYPTFPRHYTGLFADNASADGLGIGYLVNAFATADGTPRVEVVELTQIGADARLAHPDGGDSTLFERPALLLRAVIHPLDALTPGQAITVLTVSLQPEADAKSQAAAGHGWADRGTEVRARRLAQAVWLSEYLEARQIASPDEHLLVTGDFQASAVVDGMVDVVGLLRGAATNEVLLPATSAISRPLALLDATLSADKGFDRIIAGEQVLQSHFLASAPLVAAAMDPRVDLARLNAQWAVDNAPDPFLPLRVGNNDPIRLAYGLPTLERADLFTDTFFSEFDYPESIPTDLGFDFSIGNRGPRVGRNPGIDIELSRPLAFVASSGHPSAPDFTCTPAQVLADRAIARCTPASALPELASSFSATISVRFTTEVNNPSGYVLRVRADADAFDPEPGNNARQIVVHAVAGGDLLVQLSPPAQPLSIGDPVYIPVSISNNGPGAVVSPRVDITINTDRGLAVDEILNLACDAPSVSGGQTRLRCAVASLAPFTSGSARLRIQTDDSLDAAGLRIEAVASSDSNDPLPDNNTAQLLVPREARLQLTWSGTVPNPVLRGTTLDLAWELANTGSAAAESVQVLFVPPPSLDITVTPPAQWSCVAGSPPQQGTQTCTGPALAAGQRLSFAMSVATDRAVNTDGALFGTFYSGNPPAGGSYIPVYMTFNSPYDSAIHVVPPKGSLRKGQTGRLSLVAENLGPSPMPAGLLVFETNLPRRTLQFVGHPNWHCDIAGGTPAAARFECRNTAPLPAQTREAIAFDLTPSFVDGNLDVELRARLFTDSGELHQGNNFSMHLFRFAGPVAVPVTPALQALRSGPVAERRVEATIATPAKPLADHAASSSPGPAIARRAIVQRSNFPRGLKPAARPEKALKRRVCHKERAIACAAGPGAGSAR